MTAWPPARADARVGQGAQPGSKKIQMHGETRKYEGMGRTYWYAAMPEDAAQRSRWTFYEIV